MTTHCYPVHFRAEGPIATDVFGAITCVTGRLVAQTIEDGQAEIWIVSPSGVYVVADSLQQALDDAFRKLGRGLSVLAEDSGSYEEYDMRSKRLLEHPLAHNEERWNDACAAASTLPERTEFAQWAAPPGDDEIVNHRGFSWIRASYGLCPA